MPLQFLGIIDEEGKRTEKGHEVLLKGDKEFPIAFEELVRDGYKDLFELRGDDAWALSKADLVAYFRTTDKTSDVIGGRQAAVFQAFRVLAGHEQIIASTPQPTAGKSKVAKAKAVKVKKENTIADKMKLHSNIREDDIHSRRDMALTVRIEINLPAEASRESYDNIFKSIKANLLDE